MVSGDKLEVFFCDPLISSGDIWGFLVQWDTEEDFAQAIAGGDTGRLLLFCVALCIRAKRAVAGLLTVFAQCLYRACVSFLLYQAEISPLLLYIVY